MSMTPEKPVFMMHIAKTAGSYVNKVFMDSLEEGHAKTHLERSLGSHETFMSLIDDGVIYFSGHIYYATIDKILKLSGKKGQVHLITALREPFSHLVSHIKWLDHYNLPEQRREYNRLPERVKRLVEKIGTAKFDDHGSIDNLLTNLSAAGVQFLDNCQARYFLADHNSILSPEAPLTLDTRMLLATRLKDFSKVLMSTSMDQDITDLSDVIGFELTAVKEKVNQAKSVRDIDITNPLVRSILAKRLTVDIWLWQHVQKLKATGQMR